MPCFYYPAQLYGTDPTIATKKEMRHNTAIMDHKGSKGFLPSLFFVSRHACGGSNAWRCNRGFLYVYRQLGATGS